MIAVLRFSVSGLDSGGSGITEAISLILCFEKAIIIQRCETNWSRSNGPLFHDPGGLGGCEILLPSDHGEPLLQLLRFGDLLEKGCLLGSCFHIPRLFALHHNNSLKNLDFNLGAVHFYIT